MWLLYEYEMGRILDDHQDDDNDEDDDEEKKKKNTRSGTNEYCCCCCVFIHVPMMVNRQKEDNRIQSWLWYI